MAGALALIAAAPPPGRVLIGRHGGWAAFRDAGACFAVAQPPARARGPAPPFLAFTRRPGMAGAVALSVRLSRARDPRTPVTVQVGERRFMLQADGGTAWARDARDDARILAALRASARLDVRATGVHGGAFRDVYDLAGAPSAIDAAILACLAR